MPWRDVVVHGYVRVNPGLVRDTVDHQLTELATAIRTR